MLCIHRIKNTNNYVCKTETRCDIQYLLTCSELKVDSRVSRSAKPLAGSNREGGRFLAKAFFLLGLNSVVLNSQIY